MTILNGTFCMLKYKIEEVTFVVYPDIWFYVKIDNFH